MIRIDDMNNKKWFLQIEDKNTNNRISICDNGLVYGTERGHKLGILDIATINRIKSFLNGKTDINGNPFTDKNADSRINYMYMFKTYSYIKSNHNNLILRLRDDSRKNRQIKIVGVDITKSLLNIIDTQSNWYKFLD